MNNLRGTLTFIFILYMLLIVGCTAIIVFGSGNEVNTDHDMKHKGCISIDSNNIGIEVDSNNIINNR